LAILTDVSHDFPQSLQADARIVPQIRQLSLPSTFFPIHYSLIILPFDAIQLELLTALLNKPQINNQQEIVHAHITPVPDTELQLLRKVYGLGHNLY
jgi:hypothetical protein